MEFGALDRLFAETLLKKQGDCPEGGRIALMRLMNHARSGHLCAKREFLGDGVDLLSPLIVEEGTSLFPKAPVVRYQDLYYLQKNWVYETHLLQLTQKLRRQAAPAYFNRTFFCEQLEELLNSGKLLSAQAKAIGSVLNQSLSVICGGPGTGKTYTAAHLVKLLFASRSSDKPDFRVCLAAPTGKAAFHLRSALDAQGVSDPHLQIESQTLHRHLKLQPGATRLFSNRKIDADLVIVDEASMIDVPLLAHLLEAIGEETSLVLIGDPHQLPPVGSGGLFAEMGHLFGVHLDRCVRTDEPMLQELAGAVKMGESDRAVQAIAISSDSLMRPDWPFDGQLTDRIYKYIEPVSLELPPDPKLCMEHYNQYRVLNALRQGPYGSDALNRDVFSILQGKNKWWAAPILAMVNDPYSDLYNGMSGVLIGKTLKDAIAYFPDPSSEEMRQFSSPPPYELAFCLSIHKSQGSEFQHVLALFPEGSEHFGREALYTAVTRAKKSLKILGSDTVLQQMLAEHSCTASGFSRRLTQETLS